MHELSLCRSVYDIVERARTDRAVAVVHMRIGRLRQVVPRTLEHCWEIVTTDTPLDNSRLEIEHVAIELRCRACGAATEVADRLLLTCAGCGGADVEVVRGEELLVTTLELRE